MLCGTDIIMQNIPHIQFDYCYAIVNPHLLV